MAILVVLVKVVFVIDIVVMIVDALLDYPSAKSGGDEEQRRKGWNYLEKESFLSAEEKENGDGKGKEYLEDENIWTVEENKNREGQGGKYLKNEKVITDKENYTK